jgi:Asp-tRNA(Asn)/Glu-tRNA(Gln) amidotransferase A subunit family amidase
MPACAIPMCIGDEGVPLSLHIMGPPGHDMEVLYVAQKIEELINCQNPKFYEDPSNSMQANKEEFHVVAM